MLNNRPIKISLIATPLTSPSNLYGLFEVLGSVGLAWETYISGEEAIPRFDVKIVAVENEPFKCVGDVPVVPHQSIDDVHETDVVLVASILMARSMEPPKIDPRVHKWIIEQYEKGAVIAATCTSSIVVAQTGLLDGYEATSHFMFRDFFRRYFPKIRAKLDKHVCVAGDNNRIVSSGGATSWEELALYLVTRFHGVDAAVKAAKYWLIPKREELQASFTSLKTGTVHQDAEIGDCQEWIADNYAEANPVAAVTELSGMAPATFARRFKRATGYRPMEYIQAVRVEEAKQLLETSLADITEIGEEVGYEDTASFRRIFKRRVGMTPGEYRTGLGRARFEPYRQTSAAE